MSFKGAIFDLDGTLLDSMWIWHEVDDTYLRSKGKVPEKDLSRKLSKKGMMESVFYFQQQYDIQEPADQMASDLWGLAEYAYRYKAKLKPNVYNFVKELNHRGIQCVVATASDKNFTKAALERCGVANCFENIITCDEIGKGKIAPDVFFAAQKCLNLKQDEVIIFEDALHAIQTAKSAGFTVAAVYDLSAEHDMEQIKKTADIYLTSLIDWNFEKEI